MGQSKRWSLLSAGAMMFAGALTGAALTANRGLLEFFGWTLFYTAGLAPIWLGLALLARRNDGCTARRPEKAA